MLKKKKYTKYKPKGKSWGERVISKYLDELKIEYKYDASLDLINPFTAKKLRFDFYLPKHNLCIEYQGKQHYGYVPELHGLNKDKGLIQVEEQKFKDKLKVQYCKEKNIRLLIISYLQYKEIKELINQELKKGLIIDK